MDPVEQEMLSRLVAAREAFNAAEEYMQHVNDLASLDEISANRKRSLAEVVRGELNELQQKLPVGPDK